MPVVDGERFRHDAPRVLFALDPDTSWTSESLPDGQGFILIRRDMKAPGQVMMVRNFFELLRQKVGQ